MASTEPPPLITECPNCHTRFRVGESQLQIAHGRVRCGACLAVFAGVDHLLLDDSVSVPELPAEGNMLESVLAELAEEDRESAAAAERAAIERADAERAAVEGRSVDSVATPDTDVADPADMGVTAARAYELEALAARRGDSQELELSGGFLATDAPENIEEDITLEPADDADWTSVAVDTQEFGPRVTLELAGSGASSRFEDAPPEDSQESANKPAAERRVTIEDALEDEEALRWWLEDELPGEANDFAADDDLVVQLSELDAVRDEDLDLQELLATPDNGSKSQLEALFRELREDESADVTPDSRVAEEQPVEVRTAVGDEADESAEDEVFAEVASERSAAELHAAIDQAEPLVTRALANGTLAASADTAAGPERAVAAGQTADLESKSDPLDSPALRIDDRKDSDEGLVTTGDLPVGETTAQAADGAGWPAGRAVELVEPPPERQAVQAQSWNSESFPATPAELVENITAEMAAAGRAEPAADEVEGTPEESLWQRATQGLERLLGNPYALRAGTLLASVLFVGQVMFWQFDEWAKTPTLRPVYAGLCSVVGCELPLRRSVQDMQSRKLAVRSHPDKAGKLLVDALIINEAEFEQPFPIIELQFMDLNQRVVGSYQLEPGSYLDGELAGSDALMAVRTPVHIDIEIADPGPTAVNYQLQFR